MRFSEIIGQADIKKSLLHAVKNGRVSHAQLIIGPEGCGKLSMALAYAQYVCCENKQEFDSCGECPSCHKIAKLAHPDLHFVFPVIKKGSIKPVSDSFIDTWRHTLLENPYISPQDWYKAIEAEKSQGMIYVEESAEILKKLNLKSYESEYKVMVIWLPEKMHQAAANKLLKLLEEPPPKTLFLLVSEDPDQIIGTILSRTQMIKMSKIDDESLYEALTQKYDLPEREINNIVRLAKGNFNRAGEIIQISEEHKWNLEIFINLMRLSWKKDIAPLVELIEKLADKGREKQKAFLSYCLHMVRENFVMHASDESLLYLTTDEADFSKNFHKVINEKNIGQILHEFNQAHYHIERNGNAKIVLFDLCLKLSDLLKQ